MAERGQSDSASNEARSNEPASSTVVVALMGRLRVTVDGEVVDVTAEQERTLLALLVAGGDVGYEAERLIDELWESPTAGSKGTLQTYVSNLRRLLRTPSAPDSTIIERVGDSYRLDPAVVATDLAGFRRHVARARHALAAEEPDRALATRELGHALALHGGPIDPGVVRGTNLLSGEAAALASEVLEATWQWLELEIQGGRAADVVPQLDGLVKEHPTDERFWRQLMLAYWQTGRQQQALQAYQEVRRVLADEVGILPTPSLQDLEQAILRHDPQLGKGPEDSRLSVPRPRGSVPATVNSFIGRDEELERLVPLVNRNRLVTFRGPGGSGKTRLAKEVARRVHDDFDGGAWWVAFGEVDDAGAADGATSSVVETIATTFGMIRRSQHALIEALIEQIQGARTLLVLDNCEHLIDAIADVVARLLAEAPELHIVTTTRESLRVVGEMTVPIESLALDSGDGGDMTDAARLFLDRADAAGPTIGRDPESVAVVEEICRRLDGLPLAIELAAALVATTPLASIVSDLGEDRFELLAVGARGAARQHQTLEAVVDWSYDRLSDDEREAFAAVSVFPGSFSLGAASAVTALSSPKTKRRLDGLVRKSIVETVTSDRGVERYRMLETLRHYGLRRLDESGATSEVETRFITHFVGLAEHTAYDPTTSVIEWFEELGPDIANLRFAIRRAIETDAVGEALRLIDAFHWYFNYVGSLTEAEEWLLSIVPDRPAFVVKRNQRRAEIELDPRQVVMAYTSLASLGNLRGNYSETGYWADRAVVAARELGDVHRRHAALVIRGATAVFENRQDVAIEAFNESLELSTELGDRWGQGVALTFMAVGARRAADQQRRADPASDWSAQLAKVGRQLERAYEIFSQFRDDRAMAMVLINLGRIEEHRGDFERAVLLCDRGLALAENYGDDVMSALARLFRGRMAVEQGDEPLAVECFVRSIEIAESLERSRVMFSASAEWLGIIAARHGDVEPLLRIAAATEVFREAPPSAAALPELHEEKQRARKEVGGDRAEQLEEDGRAMGPNAVKALAVRAARTAVS